MRFLQQGLSWFLVHSKYLIMSALIKLLLSLLLLQGEAVCPNVGPLRQCFPSHGISLHENYRYQQSRDAESCYLFFWGSLREKRLQLLIYSFLSRLNSPPLPPTFPPQQQEIFGKKLNAYLHIHIMQRNKLYTVKQSN